MKLREFCKGNMSVWVVLVTVAVIWGSSGSMDHDPFRYMRLDPLLGGVLYQDVRGNSPTSGGFFRFEKRCD